MVASAHFRQVESGNSGSQSGAAGPSRNPETHDELLLAATDRFCGTDTHDRLTVDQFKEAFKACIALRGGHKDIHGALKAAVGLHGKTTNEARLLDIPDTVYFLTDGSPTRGEITGTPELLGWFRNLNRFAKVRLHVVAFGNLGVDIDFLRSLAAAGDGDLIHVPEK